MLRRIENKGFLFIKSVLGLLLILCLCVTGCGSDEDEYEDEYREPVSFVSAAPRVANLPRMGRSRLLLTTRRVMSA